MLVCVEEECAVVWKSRREPTIWNSPSPKFIMGGSEETKYDHPTQKPVDLMRPPILNLWLANNLSAGNDFDWNHALYGEQWARRRQVSYA